LSNLIRMNILAIDTVDFTSSIGIYSQSCPPRKPASGRCGLGKMRVATFSSQKGQLLAEIDKLLKSKNIKINDIDGFVAYLGPGESFTGTRVGISVVNALCFALEKPSLGYHHIPETDQKARVYQILQRSSNIKKFVRQILKPVYSSPAKVTLKK
jgi:tRNA A37 threonylcarbamoyladenosine modification protein TsaB